MKPRRRQAGLTLVEISVAVVLLVIFTGGTLLVGSSLTRAFRSETTVAQQNAALHDALEDIASRLQAVDGDNVLPAGISAPLNSPNVDFFRATGHDGTAIVWGPQERFLYENEESDPNDGLDNDGDGLVDEGRVVWTRDVGGANEQRIVICKDVREVAVDEIPANGIDDNGNGLEDEAGLAFERTGDSMRILLSLEWISPEGNVKAISAERTVVLRNTGVTAP